LKNDDYDDMDIEEYIRGIYGKESIRKTIIDTGDVNEAMVHYE
jgi:hypothetical protein